MPTKNIFAGGSVRATFVSIIYEELKKREFVSYADVLSKFLDNNKIDFNKQILNTGKGYNQLRKAFPEVIQALETVCPGCIVDNGKKGKGKAFKYIGDNDDPLAEDQKAVVQKSVEDYVAFCKASAGILPASWFSSFFENTQILLDTNRESKDGEMRISSGAEQNLTNIDLLPVFYKAIANKQVLRFDYQPFGQELFTLTFHPQFIKEHNGRWFVFGDADREPYQAYNVPLDRIVGNVCEVDDVEYISAPKGFYQDYFNNIIGVTHETGAKTEEVIIRTKTEYQHGLLLTKPLHHSQNETQPFGEHDGQWYGENRLERNGDLRVAGRRMCEEHPCGDVLSDDGTEHQNGS